MFLIFSTVLGNVKTKWDIMWMSERGLIHWKNQFWGVLAESTVATPEGQRLTTNIFRLQVQKYQWLILLAFGEKITNIETAPLKNKTKQMKT